MSNPSGQDIYASRAARFGPAPNTTIITNTSNNNNNNPQQRSGGGYGGHHHRSSNNYNSSSSLPSTQQHAAYAHHGVVPSSNNNFSSRRPHQPTSSSSSRHNHHDRNRKPMSAYDEKCAVRIGVLDARRPITEQDIMNELVHIRLSAKVEAIFIESSSSLRSSPDSSLERDVEEANKHKAEKQQQQQQEGSGSNAAGAALSSKDTKVAILTEIGEGEPKVDPQSGKSLQWARVFMSNPDVADECAAEFAFPGAEFRWRLIVQRLPIVNHFAELTKKLASPDHPRINQAIANNIFHPLQNCPIPQVIVVDTQEGYVPFMTTELFQTRGAADYIANKETKGHLMRRTVCKHYDPQSETDCFFGVNCSFVHLHAAVFARLLRIQSFKTRLRLPAFGAVRRPEDAVQHCNWEVERRADTLMVRDIPESVGEEQLNYMFSGCQGFISCAVRHTPYEGRRYGVVRMASRKDALTAMAQTFGCGLSISFFGALEDLRALRIKETIQEEEEERKRKLQEREERMASRHNKDNHHNPQQQQDQNNNNSTKDNNNNIKSEGTEIIINYTSKKFGGSNLQDKESGQRRQREEGHEGNENKQTTLTTASESGDKINHQQNAADDSQFANEVLELRQSDSDNGDDDDENKKNNNTRDENERGRYNNNNNTSDDDDDEDEEDDDDDSTAAGLAAAGLADDAEPNSEVAQPINLAKPTASDFPPLPQGWDWGFTRRLNRYYFFETLKRNKTSWKHPVTNKSYAVGGAEC